MHLRNKQVEPFKYLKKIVFKQKLIKIESERHYILFKRDCHQDDFSTLSIYAAKKGHPLQVTSHVGGHVLTL